jgi:hypothetical protein
MAELVTLVIADRRADIAFGAQDCGGGGIADGRIVGGILCWLWLLGTVPLGAAVVWLAVGV